MCVRPATDRHAPLPPFSGLTVLALSFITHIHEHRRVTCLFTPTMARERIKLGEGTLWYPPAMHSLHVHGTYSLPPPFGALAGDQVATSTTGTAPPCFWNVTPLHCGGWEGWRLDHGVPYDDIFPNSSMMGACKRTGNTARGKRPYGT